MRILLLTTTYLGLEKAIIEELHNQGHSIFVLEDKALSTDCYTKVRTTRLKILNYVFRLYNRLFRVYESYWKKMILKYDELRKPFDLFFCIQGQSFHPCLLNYLKSVNPAIKTSLYIWDTNEYYDFARNLDCFMTKYSFDYHDCQKFPELHFLPFYWVKKYEQITNKYELSIIGTDHDGRFEILYNLYPQIKHNLTSYFVRIVIPPQPLYYWPQYKKWIHAICNKYKNVVETWQFKNLQEFTSTESIPYYETEKIISSSNCILDTDRDSQFGTTPRMIWALASGKKIVTTNGNVKQLPFYNEKQILIIDRNAPEIDWNFVKAIEEFPVSDYIDKLRIDKWVMNFLI